MRQQSVSCEVVDAWPTRLPIFLFWAGYLMGLLVFVPGYYFEDNDGLIDRFVTAAVYFLIISLFLYLFFSASVVLFTRVPIVRVAGDKVSLPLIGLEICRNEVLEAARQSSKASQHWRVSIELKAPKHRMFRAWMLFPTAYAVGHRIYVFPLFLGPRPDLIQHRIVDALSSRASSPEVSNG